MHQDCYLAPRNERWVIERLAGNIAVRLQTGEPAKAQAQSLFRLLFGLQRFPRLTAGLNVDIEWPDMETSCVIRMTPEHLSIERAHTRLQYFVGSHHLLSLYENLTGLDRHDFLENWLPLFDGLADPEERLTTEDYSKGGDVDVPPLNEQWLMPLPPIFFDLD